MNATAPKSTSPDPTMRKSIDRAIKAGSYRECAACHETVVQVNAAAPVMFALDGSHRCLSSKGGFHATSVSS